MSDFPPPPPPPPAGGPPPPPPPPMPGGYGGVPQAAGVPRPGELLDRFLARLIDGVILFAVGIVIGVFIVGALVSTGSSDFASFIITAIGAVVSAAISLGYFAYLESSRGQTVGKMALKLRTFGPDGRSNPTMEQALKRNIFQGYAILGLLPIIGGFIGFIAFIVAAIMIAVNISGDPARRQSWADRFAGGTQVMKIG